MAIVKHLTYAWSLVCRQRLVEINTGFRLIDISRSWTSQRTSHVVEKVASIFSTHPLAAFYVYGTYFIYEEFYEAKHKNSKLFFSNIFVTVCSIFNSHFSSSASVRKSSFVLKSWLPSNFQQNLCKILQNFLRHINLLHNCMMN